MLEDALRADAQALDANLDDHDTDAFMHRLAVRIAQDAALPPRVRVVAPGEDPFDEPHPDAASAPPPAAPARAARPAGTSRPRTRRGQRRAPTPIYRHDPAASEAAVLEHVRRLCRQVVSSDDIDLLADFAADYDQAGARTFACLLYTLNRRDGALFWWRFAAGAGDPLAAYLLAAHHAAVGTEPEARVWRFFSRLLGFSSSHLPRTDRGDGEGDGAAAWELVENGFLRAFMKAELPPALSPR
ncbi:hypothetical protein ACFVY0_39385 [Streptomyces sp. NPDC058286]|uniref:hypothetical protein n=1 Tax=Streptomyces sp. NPDC058286 TaxID=3346422 RepID=UPI0036EC8616